MQRLLLTSILLLLAYVSKAQCPVITVQPMDTSYCSGETAQLWIEATGNISYYQWFRFNEPIPNSNSPMLQISDVTPSDSDYYRCEVYADGCDTVTSGAVMLSVSDAPNILEGPASGWICEGMGISLYVAAEDNGSGITYQWLHNGDIMPDVMGPNLMVDDVTVSDSGTYTCLVGNASCGATTAVQADWQVLENPAITSNPVGGSYCTNDQIYMSVSATGSGLHYQWVKDQQDIGADGPYIVILSAYESDAGQYSCRVWGDCGFEVWSDVAVITMDCLGVHPRKRRPCRCIRILRTTC